MKKLILNSYGFTLSAQLIELIFYYLLYSFYSKSDVGIYAWGVAVLAFVGAAVDMGLESLLIRRFSKNDFRIGSIFKASTYLRLPIILIFIISFFVLRDINQIDDNKYQVLLILIGFSVANISDSIIKAWLRANNMHLKAMAFNFFVSALRLSCLVVFVYLYEFKLDEFLFSLLILKVTFTMAFLVWFIHSTRFTSGGLPVKDELKYQVNYGVPLGLISIVSVVQNRLDWILVEKLTSVSALAIYSLANKSFEVSQVFIGVLTTLLFPILCSSIELKGKISNVNSISFVLITGHLMAVIGYILAPSVFSVIFPEYSGSIQKPIELMMVSVLFMAYSGVFYIILLAHAKEKMILIVNAAAASIQTIFNVFFISKFGIVAASFGMIVLNISSFLFLLMLMNRYGLTRYYKLESKVVSPIIVMLFGFSPMFIIGENEGAWIYLLIVNFAALLLFFRNEILVFSTYIKKSDVK